MIIWTAHLDGLACYAIIVCISQQAGAFGGYNKITNPDVLQIWDCKLQNVAIMMCLPRYDRFQLPAHEMPQLFRS